MCQYIIDNCGCNGIKKVVFDGITFCDKSMNVTKDSTKLLLKQFAQKFKNVKHVTFGYGNYNPRLLLLFRHMIPTIRKNTATVTLRARSCAVDLFKLIQDTRAAVDELNICINENFNLNVLKSLILQNKQFLQCLRFKNGLRNNSNIIQDVLFPLLVSDGNIDGNTGGDDRQISRQIVLPSLKTIDISNIACCGIRPISMLNSINNLLTLILNSVNIDIKTLFIKLGMSINMNGHNNDSIDTLDDDVKQSFEILCQNILYLVKKEKNPIAIDSAFLIHSISKSCYDKILNPIFNKYFGYKTGICQYFTCKLPTCNKYCKQIGTPQIRFDFIGNDGTARAILAVENVGNIYLLG